MKEGRKGGRKEGRKEGRKGRKGREGKGGRKKERKKEGKKKEEEGRRRKKKEEEERRRKKKEEEGRRRRKEEEGGRRKKKEEEGRRRTKKEEEGRRRKKKEEEGRRRKKKEEEGRGRKKKEENREKAMANMIVDTIVDVQIECFKNAFEKDPIENKKQKEKLEKETFPSLLKKLLAIHQQSPGAYLVGNDLTWADIFLAAFLDQWLAMYHVNGISRFSLLTDLKNKVNECPAIKAYLAKRKDTPF